MFDAKVKEMGGRSREDEGDGWSKVAKMEMEGRSEVVKVERKYNKQRRISEAL